MKIYRAELKTGNATLGITLPVDQRGACLNFQYRITPVDSTKQAFVDYCVSSSGRIYVKKVLKPEAEGGYKWKYFQKTIPPRPKQERMTVRILIHYSFPLRNKLEITYNPKALPLSFCIIVLLFLHFGLWKKNLSLFLCYIKVLAKSTISKTF